ncbi:hypothetical protein ACIBO9_04490 [Streptomyces prunicolor]|uniref:hypothetical protein n=1 Tax=Streptomyces prunicolor TaxID=67348 RepID=UPI0037D1F875
MSRAFASPYDPAPPGIRSEPVRIGTITTLNGKADSGTSTWKVSVDGAAFTGATRERLINVGDTIAVRWGA